MIYIIFVMLMVSLKWTSMICWFFIFDKIIYWVCYHLKITSLYYTFNQNQSFIKNIVYNLRTLVQ